MGSGLACATIKTLSEKENGEREGGGEEEREGGRASELL